tara:strand:+ start:94 stop:393 length:300 start_codon:yes stop_codon:yes gene_type:complete
MGKMTSSHMAQLLLIVSLRINKRSRKERYAKVYADKSYGLSKIYIFVKSPILTHEHSDEENAFYGGLTRLGWFVFEKGYGGPARLDWIDNTHTQSGFER